MSDEQTVPYQPQRTTFKRSQVAAMSNSEYQRLRTEILEAQRRGEIEDDITAPAIKANAAEQVAKMRQRQAGESGDQ